MKTLLLSSFLLASVPVTAIAQTCPEGATPVNTTDDGTTITQYCRCLPGYAVAGDKCVPNSSPASAPAVESGTKDNAYYVEHMMKLARTWGWDQEKLDRLENALNGVAPDGDPTVRKDQVIEAWNAIEARSGDETLAREASAGEGNGFPGAGTQTSYNDCAIFALASAADKPYGFVGALAVKLLAEGDWRDNPDEHKYAQQTIEQKGLWAGEVILLAEELGQAEIVPSADFANTLKEGRRVLINVAPKGGVLGRDGHEVVLTKTFRHEGETWFEMMDSNQGPQRRLYLSERELAIVLQERGVAFRPDPGGTPSPP